MLTLITVSLLGLLGALIGSFANVVIYRVPRGESIAFPGSHCPNCERPLTALDLVPIFSWLALRGRCRGCNEGIALRYPLIEAITALGFVLIALRFPIDQYGPTAFVLAAIYAMLVMMSAIDIDEYILPDSLTLPAVAVGLLGSFFYATPGGLPSLQAALFGGALGAGIIVLINRLGALVLRRFADTKERLFPVGLDQVNVAFVGGALGGWIIGLVLATASVVVNLITRRTLRFSEPLLYGLWVLALGAGSFYLGIGSLSGSLAAAGSVAVLGAVYWWVLELLGKAPDEEGVLNEEDDEPVAMGFGDVKLAAVLGVMLGWQNLLVALLLSFFVGAIGGLTLKAFGGGRVVPFGPYLAIGGLIALFYGDALLGWYLGMLGV